MFGMMGSGIGFLGEGGLDFSYAGRGRWEFGRGMAGNLCNVGT